MPKGGRCNAAGLEHRPNDRPGEPAFLTGFVVRRVRRLWGSTRATKRHGRRAEAYLNKYNGDQRKEVDAALLVAAESR